MALCGNLVQGFQKLHGLGEAGLLEILVETVAVVHFPVLLKLSVASGENPAA